MGESPACVAPLRVQQKAVWPTESGRRSRAQAAKLQEFILMEFADETAKLGALQPCKRMKAQG